MNTKYVNVVIDDKTKTKFLTSGDGQEGYLECWRNGKICSSRCVAFNITEYQHEKIEISIVSCKILPQEHNVIGEYREAQQPTRDNLSTESI